MKNALLINEWQEIKEQIDKLNLRERQIRAEITKEILGSKLEGSVTVRDGEMKITATAILNRTVDQAVLESIWEDLSWEEQQAIDYRPKLKVKAYKPFETTDSKLLEAVTVKAGPAQLRVAV